VRGYVRVGWFVGRGGRDVGWARGGARKGPVTVLRKADAMGEPGEGLDVARSDKGA
jgi:hypothetical protein